MRVFVALTFDSGLVLLVPQFVALPRVPLRRHRVLDRPHRCGPTFASLPHGARNNDFSATALATRPIDDVSFREAE